MKKGIKKIIEPEDRILIYQLKTESYLERIKIGKQDQDIHNVLWIEGQDI